MPPSPNVHWPPIPFESWKDTCSTLHLWTQIVGKIRLAQTPWLNHGWQVPLYVTARGLTTSPIPHGVRVFEMQFDFLDHVLLIDTAEGARRSVALKPQPVADFHAAVMGALAELQLPVTITDYPCEIADAVPFSADRVHAAYDADYAQRFWRVLLQVDRIMKRFRTGFLGKASPVHFFWGSFDLAVTRFSGRRAPLFMGKAPGVSQAVMREAYSHEVSSAGFWPGGASQDPAFYSYAYPSPAGFRKSKVQPSQAFYSDALGEFLLPYEAVRTAPDPDAMLLAFFQTTYEAAANSANWDRSALECAFGAPAVPRGPISS
jgi:Family of unknown function (DUF5996)